MKARVSNNVSIH